MSSRRTRAATVVPPARGEAPEAISVLTLDLGLRALQDLGLGNQDQVETGQRLEPAETLAQNAFRPVPGHRAADLARRREAQPAVRASVCRRHHQEKTSVEADSLPKCLPELRPPDHPLGVAQPRAGRNRHSRSGPDPLPPLLTPSLEDEAAALGAHPHQEAVGPLPLAVVRLEGPFHGCRLGPRDRGPRWVSPSLGKGASLHPSGLSCQSTALSGPLGTASLRGSRVVT